MAYGDDVCGVPGIQACGGVGGDPSMPPRFGKRWGCSTANVCGTSCIEAELSAAGEADMVGSLSELELILGTSIVSVPDATMANGAAGTDFPLDFR